MEETMLQVDGMSCPFCIHLIDSVLCELDGVGYVDVRLREGTVVVQHDPESAPVDSLIEAVRGVGYEARRRGPLTRAGRAARRLDDVSIAATWPTAR